MAVAGKVRRKAGLDGDRVPFDAAICLQPVVKRSLPEDLLSIGLDVAGMGIPLGDNPVDEADPRRNRGRSRRVEVENGSLHTDRALQAHFEIERTEMLDELRQIVDSVEGVPCRGLTAAVGDGGERAPLVYGEIGIAPAGWLTWSLRSRIGRTGEGDTSQRETQNQGAHCGLEHNPALPGVTKVTPFLDAHQVEMVTRSEGFL